MHLNDTTTVVLGCLFAVTAVLAYTAPPQDAIDLTGQTGYTAPAQDSIDLVAGSDETTAVVCHFTSDTTITSDRDCSGRQVNVTSGATLTLQAQINASTVFVNGTTTGSATLFVDTSTGGKLLTNVSG